MSKITRYKFSDLYEMSSGISSKPEQAGHGAPFLSFSAVFNNYFLPCDLSERMDTSEIEQQKYSINEGDILLTRTSEVADELGMSSVALKNYPNATYSGFLKRLRPLKERITYPKFMAFYLRSPLFRKVMTNNAVMTLRASLNEEIFSYLDLLLPDYDEQIKIGDFLYLLNQKIDCNNRINAELEALAKTVYDYWFLQFDFPDASGRPYKSSGGKMAFNNKLKQEIPVGWSVDCLGNLTSLIRRGISPKYVEVGGIEVLNQKCIREKKVSFIDARRHEVVLADEDERLLRSFDVLINSTGVGTLGRVAFVKRLNEEKTTVDSHVTIVRADLNKIQSEYMVWTILNFQPVIEAAANGSTGQVELNKTFIEDLKIIIPDAMLQERFSNFVKPLVKEVASREKEVEQLTQLRDWLLPLLMNGQVKVA